MISFSSFNQSLRPIHKNLFDKIHSNSESAQAWQDLHQILTKTVSSLPLSAPHPTLPFSPSTSPRQDFLIDVMRDCNNAPLSSKSKDVIGLLLDYVDVDYCGPQTLDWLVYPSSVHEDDECLHRVIELYYNNGNPYNELEGLLPDLFRLGKYSLIVKHMKSQTFPLKELVGPEGLLDTLLYERDQPLGGFGAILAYPKNDQQQKLLIESLLVYVCQAHFIQPWGDDLLKTFITNVDQTPQHFQDMFWGEFCSSEQELLDEGLKAFALKRHIQKQLPQASSSTPSKKM